MKKLLLVVAVILSLPSTAQNWWEIPTYTQYTEINTNYVYQPYQQNPYQQPIYTQPVYTQPVYHTNSYQDQYRIQNNRVGVGHVIGALVNTIVYQSQNKKCRNRTRNQVKSCNCCR